MELVTFVLVSLFAMGTFTVGILAGGMICNWEEARNKNLAQKGNNEDRKARAA